MSVSNPPTNLTPYFVQSQSYLCAALPEIESAAQVPGWQLVLERITRIFTFVAFGKTVFDLTNYYLTQYSFPRVPTRYLSTSLWAGAGLVGLYLNSRAEMAFITPRRDAMRSLETLQYLKEVGKDEPLSTYPLDTLIALETYLVKHPGVLKDSKAINLSFARLRLVFFLTRIVESPGNQLHKFFGSPLSMNAAVSGFQRDKVVPAQLPPDLNGKILLLVQKMYNMPENANTLAENNTLAKLDELLKNPFN